MSAIGIGTRQFRRLPGKQFLIGLGIAAALSGAAIMGARAFEDGNAHSVAASRAQTDNVVWAHSVPSMSMDKYRDLGVTTYYVLDTEAQREKVLNSESLAAAELAFAPVWVPQGRSVFLMADSPEATDRTESILTDLNVSGAASFADGRLRIVDLRGKP